MCYNSEFNKVLRRSPKNKKPLIQSFIFLILIFSLISGLPKKIHADSSYSLSLEPGSQILVVKYINLPLWKETINLTSDPSDWFPGTSNQTDSSSKITFLSISRNDLNTYGVFFQFFYRWFDASSSILNQNGYGSSYVNQNYDNYYFVWEYEYQTYYFSSQPLGHNWDYFDNYFVFRQPSDLSIVLDDYNNFTIIVNNDLVLQSLNYSQPLITGDEFLWSLFLKGVIVGNPINSYLLELIEALDCKNATVQDKTLTLYKRGIENYRLEIEFNEQGFMDSLHVKTTDGELIYKLSSWYPNDVVVIMWIIIFGGLFALLGFSILKQRKRLRFFKEH